jgi:hypothetical protein
VPGAVAKRVVKGALRAAWKRDGGDGAARAETARTWWTLPLRSLGAWPRGTTGIHRSVPVRAGLTGTRVAAAVLHRPAGCLLAASGYQEYEDRPLAELINGVVDRGGAGAAAHSPRALRSVAGLPAICAYNRTGRSSGRQLASRSRCSVHPAGCSDGRMQQAVPSRGIGRCLPVLWVH